MTTIKVARVEQIAWIISTFSFNDPTTGFDPSKPMVGKP